MDILQMESKYGGFEVSAAKRLRAIEEENTKLKRLLAEAMLDNAALKDLLGKMVMPVACREAVAHLRREFAMSERPACRVVVADRSSVRYRRRRPDDGLLESG
jgi:putative transposase